MQQIGTRSPARSRLAVVTGDSADVLVTEGSHACVTDAGDPSPITRILSVSSNEAANGSGDGNTNADWQITGPVPVNLRAERSGKSAGRVYTITLESRDASGNASQRTVTVAVPHNPLRP